MAMTKIWNMHYWTWAHIMWLLDISLSMMIVLILYPENATEANDKMMIIFPLIVGFSLHMRMDEREKNGR